VKAGMIAMSSSSKRWIVAGVGAKLNSDEFWRRSRAVPAPRRALEDRPRQVGVQMHREVVDRRLAGGSEIFRPRTVLAIEDAA